MFWLGAPQGGIPRAKLIASSPEDGRGDAETRRKTQRSTTGFSLRSLAGTPQYSDGASEEPGKEGSRPERGLSRLPTPGPRPPGAGPEASRSFLPIPPRASRSGPIAVLHAVAANAGKTWAAEKFLAVARHLTETGIEPLFIGGPGDDLSAFA